MFWLHDLSSFDKRLGFFFFLMFARITVLLKFSMFICYACSVDFYSLVEREKKPNRSPESFQISMVTCTLSLFSLSQ